MAGARYVASGEENLGSSLVCPLNVSANASTANRLWIYEMYFGNEGTPADLAGTYIVQRFTTIPSGGSAVTPGKLDQADRAAQSVARENDGTTGTFTANEVMIEVPMNHRGSYRWVAPPGGEWVVPAVAADGFGVQALHASATTLIRAGAYWVE